MSKFAKLFEDENGQILVMRDSCDEQGECIIVSVRPEGMGVCSLTLGYEDDAGEADKRFADFDEDSAKVFSARIYAPIKEFLQ